MTTKLRPRFGIDIDGTVTCPATLLPHINKQYNVNITLDDVVEYDFLSAFPHPVDRSQFNAWFKENFGRLAKCIRIILHFRSRRKCF